MTSAAFGVGHHSIADAFAERCPVLAFFEGASVVQGLPGEECHTRHAPI